METFHCQCASFCIYSSNEQNLKKLRPAEQPTNLLSATSHSYAKRSYWFYAQGERMTHTNSNKGILWQSNKIGESTDTW